MKPCSTTNSTISSIRMSLRTTSPTTPTRAMPPCPGSYKTLAKPDQSNSTGKLGVTIHNHTCHPISMPMQAIGWHRTKSTKEWSWCQVRLFASSKRVQIRCSRQRKWKTMSQTRVSQARASPLRKETTFSYVVKYTTTIKSLINHQNLTRSTTVTLSCTSLLVCHLNLRIQFTLKTQLIRLQSRRRLKTHLLKR